MLRPRFPFAPLALASAMAVAAVLAADPAQAQAASTDTARAGARVDVAIATQPLGQALNELARQARLELIATPALVAGKTAPAVAGRLTVREALNRLLEGSGLAADVEGANVLVRRAAEEGANASTLPAVTVTASGKWESATGPVPGYLARRSATATKTDTPLAETPQAVSVVTREQMSDQGATSVQDALTYAAGVLGTPYGLDTRTDWMRVRGADPTVYLDGLRHAYGTRSARAEPYTLERLEVLRGPSGMLYGAGTVAGVVNMVSKRPQFEAQREVSAQYGSFDLRQIQADLTGPLDAEGTLAYRIVALTRKADTQVDHVPDDRTVLAPSLTWQPDAMTSLTLSGLWQKDNSAVTSQFFPWEGTVLPNPNGPLPSHRFIGEPSDYYDSERSTFGWQFEHRFDDRWALRQNARVARNENDTVYHFADFYGNGVDAGPGGWSIDPVGKRMLRRYWWSGLTNQRIASVDTQMEGDFRTGALQHKLLLGADVTRQQERSASAFGASTIDAYAPVYGQPGGGVRKPNAKTRQHQTGVYLQDQIKWGAWILLAGLRHDRAESGAEGGEADRSSATTHRLGLLHAFDSGLSPYVSYSESFMPQSAINGRIFKPLRGEQWEAGLKYEPVGRELALGAAFYALKEGNRIQEKGVNVYDQLGEVKNRGVELEARGSIGRDLDLIAHYNYIDLDVQLDGQPRHQASVWAKQRLRIGGMPGFSAGAGVRYVSAFRDMANGGVGPKVPGVALLDFVFAYDTPKWRYALNVNNATDESYVSACMTRGDCYIGARRTIVATARYRW